MSNTFLLQQAISQATDVPDLTFQNRNVTFFGNCKGYAGIALTAAFASSTQAGLTGNLATSQAAATQVLTQFTAVGARFMVGIGYWWRPSLSDEAASI